MARRILKDPELFSKFVLKTPLRAYQLEPMRQIINSVLYSKGLEFLVILPRQTGKNELVAHLIVYLLNLFQRRGGNLVFAAIGDGTGRMLNRLDQHLNNSWNIGTWRKHSNPQRRTLGNAAAVFLSSHPQAATRGETCHHLLVIDEMQDQDESHLEAVFQPMRAANNATALYIGTVKFTHDALWRKRAQLEALQKSDGVRRVFITPPDKITPEIPHYAKFLKNRIEALGLNHPIIQSEYFLQPIDSDGGLFGPQRRALMLGNHTTQTEPEPETTYLATIDIAGAEEATTDTIAQLQNPGRDYTAVVIWKQIPAPPTAPNPQPSYHAVAYWLDHGSSHFEPTNGKPPLADRLTAYLDHWNVSALAIDSTGVGLGLSNHMRATRPKNTVLQVAINGIKAKAQLGITYIALIETNRVKHPPANEPLSPSWLFWKQAAACVYTIPPTGTIDSSMSWYVPETATTHSPKGTIKIHDDLLLAAALIAPLDAALEAKTILAGQAKAITIAPRQEPWPTI